MLLKALIAAGLVSVAFAIAATLRRRHQSTAPPAGPSIDSERADPGNDAFPELLPATLRRDLSLAAEHVHSIRWLLAIASQHQQPVPNAVLTNLELVSKNLRELERRIDAGAGEAAPQTAITEAARRP